MTRRTAPTQGSTKKTTETLRRLSVGAAALACAAGLSIAPASAAPSAAAGVQATGTFLYTTIGTPHQITNPVNGTCYSTTLGSSPVNVTDARAVVFTLPGCAGLGDVIEPGNTGDVLLFNSVRFQAVP